MKLENNKGFTIGVDEMQEDISNIIDVVWMKKRRATRMYLIKNSIQIGKQWRETQTVKKQGIHKMCSKICGVAKYVNVKRMLSKIGKEPFKE